MITSEFEEVIENTPVIYAVFTVLKVPNWVKNYEGHEQIKVGTELVYIHNQDVMRVKDSHSDTVFGIASKKSHWAPFAPSYLNFKGYFYFNKHGEEIALYD